MVTRGAHPSRKMPDEDILQVLRDLALQLGLSELTTEHVRQHLPFSDYALRVRWRTTQSAFEAVGLNTSLLGLCYTDEECYRNLLTVWTHYGRPPKHLEMGMPLSEVGGKAYMRRFGTWNKALAAFVERVNAEPSQITQEAEQVALPLEQSTAELLVRVGEDNRDIHLGLRFRIFHRDRFKCALCGGHPASNAACRLHVDHILPWSKGGKTRDDNLRTLCAECNIGKVIGLSIKCCESDTFVQCTVRMSCNS